MEYLLGDGAQPGAYTLVQAGGYPALRGMMTWSINWDAVSACDGIYSYAETFERIFDDQSTGIASMPADDILLFPNPAVNELRVTGMVPLTLSDQQGREVWRATNNRTSGVIDVSGLELGMYTFVGEAHGHRTTRRFVKAL
jgi:hypothetical protein